MFDRLFPERQIIQRSRGAVRGVRLSQGRQALAALCGLGLAGWCAYASANTLLGGDPPVVVELEYERAKYDRWLEDVRGRTAAIYETIEHMTREFDASMQRLETRHDLLRALLEYSNGSRLRLAARDRGARTVAAAAEILAEPADSDGADAAQTALLLRDAHVAVAVGAQSPQFGAWLGPAEASAAPPVAAAGPAPQDYISYLRDPARTARVAAVAARVEALRRVSYPF